MYILTDKHFYWATASELATSPYKVEMLPFCKSVYHAMTNNIMSTKSRPCSPNVTMLITML